MIAEFPEIVEIIQGEPTVREFLRVLQHLMICEESHEYSKSKSNCLVVCLNAKLYAIHTIDAYPAIYIFLGDVCKFTGVQEGDKIAKATRYAEW